MDRPPTQDRRHPPRPDIWAPDPAAFRPADPPAERLRALVAWAVLAPSTHNTQPWRFRLAAADRLELRADRGRALPVVDPAQRALVISCGAALANLRLAAAALGEALVVEPLPDPADPDLLARIRACGPRTPAAEGAGWLAAMTARRTTRFAFAPEPVPASARAAAILAAAAEGGVSLHWVGDAGTRHAIARLVAEGDRIQMADHAFRTELAAWIRSRHAPGRDGISAAAFGMPDLLSFVGALAIRTFDMGEGQAARDQALAEGSPALAVLSTPGESRRDWLATGQAMQRALLALTSAGLAASFLNQPIEVPALRPRLAAAARLAGTPQLLLRIGRYDGPPLRPASRRPAEEVLGASG